MFERKIQWPIKAAEIAFIENLRGVGG